MQKSPNTKSQKSKILRTYSFNQEKGWSLPNLALCIVQDTAGLVLRVYKSPTPLTYELCTLARPQALQYWHIQVYPFCWTAQGIQQVFAWVYFAHIIIQLCCDSVWKECLFLSKQFFYSGHPTVCLLASTVLWHKYHISAILELYSAVVQIRSNHITVPSAEMLNIVPAITIRNSISLFIHFGQCMCSLSYNCRLS